MIDAHAVVRLKEHVQKEIKYQILRHPKFYTQTVERGWKRAGTPWRQRSASQ